MPLSLVGLDLASAFYVRQAGKQGTPVLVLGSADGRVAFALAGRGHQVVAVEPSERMHETAADRRPAEPTGEVKLVHADLRTVRLEDTFAMVLAPQNALGLMGSADDFEAALVTVAHHLARDGVFAFDLRSDSDSDPPPLGRPAAFTAHMRERGGQSVRRLRRRVFTPNEVDAALSRAGLEARERYGDFLSRPWEESDEMQVVVAAKVAP